jgi:hypothetical protein
MLVLAVRTALIAGAPGQDTGFLTRKMSKLQLLSNKFLADHAWQGVNMIIIENEHSIPVIICRIFRQRALFGTSEHATAIPGSAHDVAAG